MSQLNARNSERLTSSRFIQRGTPAWDQMWALLADHPVNEGLADPSVAEHAPSGECWQYMGPGSGMTQHFRHRCHPKTGKREVVALHLDPQP